MSEMTPEAAALEKEREAEYGEFVAAEAIYAGTALAFNKGDPVPKSTVESGAVSESQVVRRATKAGKAVTGKEG